MILVSISHESGQEDHHSKKDSVMITADLCDKNKKCIVVAPGLHGYQLNCIKASRICFMDAECLREESTWPQRGATM